MRRMRSPLPRHSTIEPIRKGKQLMENKDLLLGQTQWCLVCDEVKELEQGEAVVRYGSFIEFTCYKCKGEAKK
jgi:hypothetical protein